MSSKVTDYKWGCDEESNAFHEDAHNFLREMPIVRNVAKRCARRSRVRKSHPMSAGIACLNLSFSRLRRSTNDSTNLTDFFNLLLDGIRKEHCLVSIYSFTFAYGRSVSLRLLQMQQRK